MWRYFTDLFDYLPLTALIENSVRLHTIRLLLTEDVSQGDSHPLSHFGHIDESFVSIKDRVDHF